MGNFYRLGFTNLYNELRNEMMRISLPGKDINASRFDFDFVHPSKLKAFYECDHYDLVARHGKVAFFTTTNKDLLYKAGLDYAYKESKKNTLAEFGFIISGIRVYGFRGGNRITHAMFTDHITCESAMDNAPLFKIDSRWYRVKGDFIDRINTQCLSMLKSNLWENNPLTESWNINALDEGAYNLLYHGKENFLVLDKCLGQNIELCDLLFETEKVTYLIHVKIGFDAKIRDLINQISIASNRLWDDVKSGKYEFVDKVRTSYNNKNFIESTLDLAEFRSLFDKEVVFVMAFVSKFVDGKSIVDNLNDVKSNIAKFSLIQSVREMNTEKNKLLIVEIPR